MKEFFNRLAGFSVLFEYPESSSLTAICSLNEELKDTEVCKAGLDGFVSFAGSLELYAWQEYFVKTFEVEAVCNMDLGYLLFGEDYKRGDFLSMMQHEQVSAGNDTGHELADHLPNVLRLLPLMNDASLAEELACSIVKPAVKEILARPGISENEYHTAFTSLLRLLETGLVCSRFTEYKVNKVPACHVDEVYACGTDFLKDIDKVKF